MATAAAPRPPHPARRGSTQAAVPAPPAPPPGPQPTPALPPIPDAAEAALLRLDAASGVVATAVVDAATGVVARVGGDPETAARAVATALPLATLASRVAAADDAADGLACLRVRAGRCELSVAAGDGFTLVAVQALGPDAAASA